MDTLLGYDVPRSTRPVDTLVSSADVTRDERFKSLLREQLGKNGVSLLVLYSFVLIVAVLLLALVTVSYANSRIDGRGMMDAPTLRF